MFIHTEVNNADGLKMGAAVKLKGIKVGSVKGIQFEDLDRIKITLGIVEKYNSWIRQDSTVSIKTQGVLGDKFIEIEGGSPDTKQITNNAYLSLNTTSGMKAIIDKGENIMVTANRVLGKLDILLDDMNGEHQFKKTFDGLAQIFDEKTVGDIKSLSSNMSSLSTRMSQGPGAIHSFVYDKSVYEDIRTLLGGAQRNKVLKYFIRESINKSEGVEQASSKE
jgi:phospholipid/cholesterol/gamma-HCH transport system substrate-binding protein